MAGLYCQIQIVGFYPLIMYEVMKKFLQAQKTVLPQMYLAIAANVFCLGVNATFQYGFGWGFVSAPISRAATYILLALICFGYILYTKCHVETWGGWSRECLSGWGQFLSLGIPSILVISLEWWAFELVSFISGLLGTDELAAYSVRVYLPLFIHFSFFVFTP